MHTIIKTYRASVTASLPNRLTSFIGARDRYGFPLGTTSYIVPDDIPPNVRALASIVDDIELVVFESDEISNLPDPATVAELKTLADRHNLSYTLHLPMDIRLGHADAAIRRADVEKCLRVIERMQAAQPRALIIHFTHEAHPGPLPVRDLSRWQTALDRSVKQILAGGVDPGRLCVETLSYPFDWVEELVATRNLAICLDIGHVVLNGYDATSYLDRYWERTRVVHLHGVSQEHDHLDITHLDRHLLVEIGERLRTTADPPVLTIEVFDETKFCVSLEHLEKYLS